MVLLKRERLKRYKDVALLLVKYGRSDLVKQAGLEDSIELEEDDAEAATPEAEELASDLEKLGPTFIKLGQLLSTRADLLPKTYLEALSRLQDQIEPFPDEEVERIVAGEQLFLDAPAARHLGRDYHGHCWDRDCNVGHMRGIFVISIIPRSEPY